MRMTILGPASPFRGGIAAYNERLAITLQMQGHEIDIHTFTLQYPRFLFPGKTQYTESPAPGGLNIYRSINSVNPFNWKIVGNRLRRANLDLVITRFWLPFMGPCFGTILRRIKRNKKTKVICIVDNLIPHESRIGDQLFTKYFIKPVDAFLAMSDKVMQDIATFDTKKPRICTPHPIYNHYGQLEDRDTALKKLNLPPSKQYLLFFGLIRPYKGLDLLLEAFGQLKDQLPKLNLIIAGEYYKNQEKYTQLLHRYGLKGRTLDVAKFIPDTEVATYFSACDLVVQPYKTATQSGVTQIAYHFDKPMIVTDVGGLSEMCPDGKVGYVVKPNAEELAKAIHHFFTTANREAIKAGIREEKKRYSWEILCEEIFNLADKIEV